MKRQTIAITAKMSDAIMRSLGFSPSSDDYLRVAREMNLAPSTIMKVHDARRRQAA